MATPLYYGVKVVLFAAFLGNIRDAYENNPDLVFLGNDEYFKNILQTALPAWRKVVAKAIESGLPMPCMTSALTFLDSYTTARLPANLLQAQRDYFGAHTYERIDQPRGAFFHTNWTGNRWRHRFDHFTMSKRKAISFYYVNESGIEDARFFYFHISRN